MLILKVDIMEWKMLDIKNDFIKKDSRMTWHNNHP